MQLHLNRFRYNIDSTIGVLLLNGVHECFTLEDRVREPLPWLSSATAKEWKIKGETAIPRGTYEIDWTYSPAFSKMMLLLKDVPAYSGIRIHAGNTHTDTAGCILTGELWDAKQPNTISKSRKALFSLQDKLVDYVNNTMKEQTWITIT